ncbi:MAG: DUF2206 domain-containing protein [Chloroflexi bacterium]|nr:DUF2206 domain-containing protein [Chloroflexota bacterium]
MPRARTSSRQGLAIFLAVILITDLSILLDIPVVRPVLGFTVFNLLPGWLGLAATRQDRLSPSARILLSLAISIALLMVLGLAMDGLLVGIGFERPLTTGPVLVTFSGLAAGMALLALRFNPESLRLAIPQWQLNPWEKLLAIVPLAFPALALAGTRLMDDTGSNALIVALFISVIGYLVFIGLAARRAPNAPFAWIIYLIALGLMFAYSTRTNFVIGQDAHLEWWAFQQTVNAGRIIVSSEDLILSVVSMTLLPAVWYSLVNVTEYLFKIGYPLVFAALPAVLFLIGRRYVAPRYAFFGAMLLVVQARFLMSVELRSVVATLFLASALLVVFSRDMQGTAQKGVFLLLIAAQIVSHYSSSYAMFFVFAGGWIVIALAKRQSGPAAYVTGSFLGFAAVAIFLWYSQLFVMPFESGVGYINTAVQNLVNFFKLETRSQIASEFLTGRAEFLLRRLNVYLYYLMVGLLFAGLAITALRFRGKQGLGPLRLPEGKPVFEFEYLAFSIVSFSLLAGALILPRLSTSYDLNRFFVLALSWVSVFFAVGGLEISRYIRVPPGTILLGLLVALLLFSSGLVYQAFGMPYRATLNTSGYEAERFIVRDQEVRGVDWLAAHYNYLLRVRGDFISVEERLSNRISISKRSIGHLDRGEEVAEGYIFLRYPNVRDGVFFNPRNIPYPLSDYEPVLATKNKVYASNGAEVYMATGQPIGRVP